MQIILPHNFIPRDYQLNILTALDSGVKRALWCVNRRGGKDLTIWNWIIKTLAQKKQTAFYILPTYSQAKKIIWEGMTKEGIRFTDFIPKELIEKKSESELSIRLFNGSYIQLIGSESYDRLVGTNPTICVFSEYAIQNPTAWDYIRPILAENNGTAVFISTPRGKNHFHSLYRQARESNDWFCEKLTVEETKCISLNAIEKERISGMSEEMIQQEFYCSFDIGQLGSFYGKIMQNAYDEGRIGHVPYDKNLLVYTAWDLGFTDSMSIIFFQKRGNEILIIDHYENNGYQLSHYLEHLRSKPYAYGKHFAPFDAKAHDRTGNTFVNIAREQGFDFEVLPQQKSIMEGIEKVRGLFPRVYMDKKNCEYLIRCLLEYHAEWDDNAKVFRNRPLHNWASHSSDALRYLCQSLDFINPQSSMSKERLKEMKQRFGYIT